MDGIVQRRWSESHDIRMFEDKLSYIVPIIYRRNVLLWSRYALKFCKTLGQLQHTA